MFMLAHKLDLTLVFYPYILKFQRKVLTIFDSWDLTYFKLNKYLNLIYNKILYYS